VVEGRVNIKIWQLRSGETMLAICDCNLIGKRVTQGKLVLDICKDFYGGEEVNIDAAVDLLRKATVANFVGTLAVSCGIAAGMIHRDAIIEVGGVPHAQFILI